MMADNPFIDPNLDPNVTGYPNDAGSTGSTGYSGDDPWYPGKWTKRLIYAGLGAVASAIDNAGDTFDRFADRGERVADELTGRVDDVRRQNAGAGDRARDYARSGVNAFLDSINVPNKGDVDTINIKLNILTRKLDELQMDRVRDPAPDNQGEPFPSGGEVAP